MGSGGGLEAVVVRKVRRSEAETCRENDWVVGTVLRGHERWGNGEGVWTTIRITAIGERSILARCFRHERTAADGTITSDAPCRDWEGTWTLDCREWTEVTG